MFWLTTSLAWGEKESIIWASEFTIRNISPEMDSFREGDIGEVSNCNPSSVGSVIRFYSENTQHPPETGERANAGQHLVHNDAESPG